MVDDAAAARASILEVQVEAALASHDLGPFDEVDTVAGGWQAICRRCRRSVWVGRQGLIYSLLEGKCGDVAEER